MQDGLVVLETYTALCQSRGLLGVEDRTGQESSHSPAYAVRNWQYYDEIYHELSINYWTLCWSLSCI